MSTPPSMFEVADRLNAWSDEGLDPVLVRVIDTAGLSSADPAAVLGWAAGRAPIGSLFSSAADGELLPMLAEVAGSGAPRLSRLQVTDSDARLAGLSCGGSARVLVQRAADLPPAFWQRLVDREPVCLITELTGDQPADSRAYPPEEQPIEAVRPLVGRRASRSVLLDEDDPAVLVSLFWPSPRVLVIGTGQIADALHANAGLLGWGCEIASVLPARLTAADCVVVLEHDLDVSGAALSTALTAGCGYLAALGSRHTQAARDGWLDAHGVPAEQRARIHGPAGLDIGSRTAAEIALSILAEIVSVRAGKDPARG